MSKHTPGPWVTNGKDISARVGPSQCYVCEVSTSAPAGGGTYKITEHLPVLIANGRLIAAAPDLLAVVQELEESAAYWSEYDVPLGIVDRLRAAIAKATGAA